MSLAALPSIQTTRVIRLDAWVRIFLNFYESLLKRLDKPFQAV